jgi:hypothetical protein
MEGKGREVSYGREGLAIDCCCLLALFHRDPRRREGKTVRAREPGAGSTARRASEGSAGSEGSHGQSEDDRRLIVAPKKCPFFSLFSCERYIQLLMCI